MIGKLGLRYVRSETDTPLFVEMALRIEAIASHTGMKGIFRLLSADVCEVEWIRPVDGFLEPAAKEERGTPALVDGPMNEIRALSLVSCRINRAVDLESLMRYSRAVRGTIEAAGGDPELRREIPLPGLPDAESQLGLPLLVEDRLIGVLALESRDPLAFEEWHEEFLLVLANQIAIGIDRLSEPAEEEAAPVPTPMAIARAGKPRRTFPYYPADDCVFVDGEIQLEERAAG